MKREIIAINEGWKFCLDPENIGLKQNWQEKDLDQNSKIGTVKTVMLPHTFNTDGESEEYRGIFWYEYDFSVPEDWEDKQIWFDFHGIYRDASFWVNGKSAGEHLGAGFTSFKLDATKLIQVGKNKLVVRGTNEYSLHALPWDRQFDWADDGGIFRPVYLNVCEKGGISSVRIHQNVLLDTTQNERIKKAPVQVTSEIQMWDDCSQENVQTEFQTNDNKNTNSKWRYELYAGAPENKGKQILSAEAPLNTAASKDVAVESASSETMPLTDTISFTVDEVTLWHFDYPQLYTVCLCKIVNDVEIDCVEVTVGFRSLTVRNSQFVLNGETVALVGTEWMPGSDPRIGNAETKEDIARWLTLLKGCNCIFTRVHWQQDDSFFDWCDRHGMLVQEEIPLWGQPKEPVTHEKALAIAQIDEMMESHFNHPSIIAWGVGNELDGQSEITAQYVKDMKSYIESKDQNRLMSYVSNTLWETPKDATALGDMIMANDYMGTWHGNKDPRVEIPRFWNEHKDKPIVISEFGLCEPAFSGGDPRRAEIFLEKIKIYRELGVNGIIWFCLNDYRTQMGEEGEGRLRRRVHGSADLYGNPKPSYETVKNECAPLYIKSVTSLNNREESEEDSKTAADRSKSQRKLQLVIANKTALPCYEACGYHLTGFNSIGSRICQIELDTLKPGETQNVLLADIKESLSRLVIERPDGSESISYQLKDMIKAMK